MNAKLIQFIASRAKDHYDGARWRDAEIATDLLVSVAPEVADYWALRGIVRRRLNKPVEALDDLRRAHDLAPEDRHISVNLGEVLCINGEIDEGIRLLAEVFNAGYEKGLGQDAQDAVTRRAGFNLAALRRLARARASIAVGTTQAARRPEASPG